MTKNAKIDLIAWINNEIFDGVALGDPKQRVADQLGAPRSWGGGDIDFIVANVWNYGIWTLFFEEGTLDAITCAIYGLHSHEWYFDVEQHEPFISGSINEVKQILAQYSIPYISFPRIGFKDDVVFTLRNATTGEIIECKRGPKVPMLVAGEGLRTSILFSKRGDRVVSIGSPFCLRTQELGYKELDSKGSYTLV